MNFSDNMPTTTSTPRTAFVLCLISYLFAGLTSTLMSAYLPDVLTTMLPDANNTEKAGEAGAYLNAISLFGWMLGGFLFGFLTDRFGRKKNLVLATLLCGAGTLLTFFVHQWHLLLGLRFVTGMGVGGILLVTTVYISECWPSASRPVALGILAVAFPAGIVASGLITVLFQNWRHAFLLGALELGVGLVMWLLLKESPDWQLSGKKQKAHAAPETVGLTASIIHGSIIFGSVLIGLWAIFSWMPTWVQSILPQGESGQAERGVVMMLLGLGGIVGGIISGFFIQRLGTRKVLIGTFAGLIVICLLLFAGNKSFSALVYIEAALLALFFGISQGALSSYIPGLFPVQIRALGSGICFNIGRFFTATSVFFVGSLVGFFGGYGNALLSFSTMFLIALIATALYSKQFKQNDNGIHTT